MASSANDVGVSLPASTVLPPPPLGLKTAARAALDKLSAAACSAIAPSVDAAALGCVLGTKTAALAALALRPPLLADLLLPASIALDSEGELASLLPLMPPGAPLDGGALLEGTLALLFEV